MQLAEHQQSLGKSEREPGSPRYRRFIDRTPAFRDNDRTLSHFPHTRLLNGAVAILAWTKAATLTAATEV